MVLCVEQSLYVVIVVLVGSLAEHLGIVVEEVGVDLVQEPLLAHQSCLHEHERRAADPVDEGACWPGVCKREVKELEDGEEGAEPVDVPVLVLFGDASLDRQG